MAEVPITAVTPAPSVPGDPTRGRQLFGEHGCAGCHTLAAAPGATGVIGPDLDNIGLRPTIGGETIENSPQNLVRWIMDPPAMKPDTAMPNLGISQQDAQDLAAFLYSVPYNPR